jgi:hypothetical protein
MVALGASQRGAAFDVVRSPSIARQQRGHGDR